MEVNTVLAHELKAPLATLRQLALAFPTSDDKKSNHLRAEMISVSERALKQVNDLAKLARLEDGLFEMEPIAIRALCDEIKREMDYLFSYHKRGLNLKYKNKSPLVTANRDLLSSIIYNFLVNAIRYSTEETKTILSISDSKNRIRVDIRDFGPALPTKIWRNLKSGNLVEPTSISMRPDSTGLALYIATKFSRYMNATVGATRHRDGTSFYIDLPISKQASLL